MTLRLKCTSTALSLVWAFGCSVATASQLNAPLMGIGTTSCGKFLSQPPETRDTFDALVVTWVQGYLSGANMQKFMDTKAQMKGQPDGESILAFINGFCRNNPLKSVVEASILISAST